MLEIRRRLIHISFGVLVILALSLWGKDSFEFVEGALLATFLVGLWIIDQKLKKRKLPVIDYMLEMFERPHALPAYGAFWYGMGILMLLSFIGNMNYVMAGIAILALGDGASTLVGMNGDRRIFYNKKKTLEGTAAFFVVGSLASYPFLGSAGIMLSLLCSIAESIDWGVDDNFIIPLTCLLFYLIFV
jgi:dolichol kinase